MTKFTRCLLVLMALCTLDACVLVPVGPRRAYYAPPPVVAPAAVFVRVH